MTAAPATNAYDRTDMVRREAVLAAGPLKVAAYRVRDPEGGAFSGLQFHMTYDNTVMAVMGAAAAKLFARFVTDTLAAPLSPDGDGWISWAGTGCPVIGERVEVRFRNGATSMTTGDGGSCLWVHSHRQTPYDIVAYRLPLADDDGWVDWTGGECPVKPGTHIEARLRGDAKGEAAIYERPEFLRWTHLKSDQYRGSGDIVAYRIVKTGDAA